MSDTIVVAVNSIYQSVYDLTGIDQGKVVSITPITAQKTPIAVLSSANKPDDDSPGIPVFYKGFPATTDADDTNVWVRGSGEIAVSLVSGG